MVSEMETADRRAIKVADERPGWQYLAEDNSYTA